MMSRARNAALPLLGRLVQRPASGSLDRLLVIQPDHVGDLLLAQPAVRLLRERLGSAHIIAVVGPWAESAARLFWPVDEIVTVRFPGFDRSSNAGLRDRYSELHDRAQELRELDAGRAVVLRPDAWWAAWLAAMATPEVVASDDPRVAPFATQSVRVEDDAHAVVRALRIAAGVTGDELANGLDNHNYHLSLPLDGVTQARAISQLDAFGVTRPFAVLHPGAGVSVKEWPAHRWRALARYLTQRGMHVVVTGSESERALAASLCSENDSVTSIAGVTPLPVLASVLAEATVVVGPDTGPLHVAVAVGTPSVHLFGPSDSRRYGPWGDVRRHRVVAAGMVCARCGDLSPSRGAACGCMLAIQVSDVIEAIEALIGHA